MLETRTKRLLLAATAALTAVFIVALMLMLVYRPAEVKLPEKWSVRERPRAELDRPRKLYYLKVLVSNVGGGAGNEYLRVKLILEFKERKLAAEIQAKEPLIYNTVLTTVQKQDAARLKTMSGKRKFKEELMEEINRLLDSGRVANIFFEELLLM